MYDLNFSKENTTASNSFSVLGQRKEGKVNAIYYASKTLNEAQVNYATTKKELLAMVFAFKISDHT